MQALLNRQGYTATRYQGNAVQFDASQREVRLLGDAAIERQQTTLVGDTVVYNDSTKDVIALGDTVVLRDPTQGAADLVASGRLQYNLAARAGLVTDLCTSVDEGGQKWFVCGQQSGFRTDSSTGAGGRAGTTERTFYAHDGAITSCDLKVPHYHFQAGDVKIIQKRLLVARPAVLYIHDVPVMWIPFLFQDMRSGRRSGILSPRIGFNDIVRNNPGYRRQIENLGYYFALSDYYDATVSFDWRSTARGTDADPGWSRYNGEFQYHWLDRFLSGSIRTSYEAWGNRQQNLAVSWGHSQQFSQASNLNLSINYVKNTTLLQRNAWTLAQALAAITSQVNFTEGLGPASLVVGGTRSQYSGRDLVDQAFPTITLSTKPIEAGKWLVWSPGLNFTNHQTFNVEGLAGIQGYRYFVNASGQADSTRLRRNARQSTLGVQTPIRVFGFDWQNSISVNDIENDYPELVPTFYLSARDSSLHTSRVFSRGFRTDVDWQTGFALPALLQGTWNFSPSISIVNSDPSAPFLVRDERTGGRFVRQGKRLQYGASVSPHFFGFLPGFGPIARIRHSIEPRMSYSYAPSGSVSDAYLLALNRTRVGYLGALRQNSVTLDLAQEFEAKLASAKDTVPGGGDKIKLLSLTFSPFTYDFERARVTRRALSGVTTTDFSWSARSDLLPGFDVTMRYSLFEGNPISDTARFKPYRTDIQASFTIGRDRNPFAALTRVFGRSVPSTSVDTMSEAVPAVQSATRIAGTVGTRYPLGIQTGQGWSASFTFSSNRQRPIRTAPGTARVFDPRQRCAAYQSEPILFNECVLANQTQRDTVPSTLEGSAVTQYPAQTNLRANFTFGVTPSWAVEWGTGYDFERHQFADHTVTLQRDMHDWRAVFGFTQAVNGNFAFTFFISLKAQPDIKYDYHRSTYRPTGP